MTSPFFSIQIDKDVIHGIIDKPQDDVVGHKRVIIFLSGMGGYRTGPHDLFVSLSTNLVLNGYYCVRFDYRGKGYSGNNNFKHSYESMLDDIRVVISYVNSLFQDCTISLLGICVGAKLALYLAKNGNQNIYNLILLSCIPLREFEKDKLTSLKQTSFNMRTYFNKIFDKETWCKIFNNDIDYIQIINNIFRPFAIRGTSRKYENKKSNDVALRQNDFEFFRGAVFNIFGQNDPETEVALPQILELLDKNKIDHYTHIIANANHGFYSTTWTHEIACRLIEWIGGGNDRC